MLCKKWSVKNQQWGLRLWSKTNLTFGKGFEQLNQFRAAQNIPCPILENLVADEEIIMLNDTNYYCCPIKVG